MKYITEKQFELIVSVFEQQKNNNGYIKLFEAFCLGVLIEEMKHQNIKNDVDLNNVVRILHSADENCK